MRKSWPIITLSELIHRKKVEIVVQELETYSRLTIHMNGGGISIRDRVQGSTIGTKLQFVVKAGQLVLSKIDARNGAFGIVLLEGDDAIITGNFWAYDVNPELLNIEFFNYLTKTPLFIDFCVRASDGTTNRLYLQEAKFLAQKILLPPIEEQHRIVARIEELAAKIEKAQNLHQEAVSKAMALSDSVIATILTALPKAEIMSVEDIAEVRGGIQKSPNRLPGDNPVRYLTVAHVHRDYITLEDPRFFEVSPAELKLWKLESGDVLVIEGNGSADQIGRAALFRGEIDQCVHQNHVIRIRPDQKRIDPEFLNIYFNSPVGKEEIQSQSRTTSGLRTLSVGRIKQINVIVPSLSTQRQIITSLNDLQLKVNILKQRQAKTSAKLNAMLPSILDKAFKGEL